MTELDPDAPLRQGRALAPDNAKDEERVLGRIWRLVRAGALQCVMHRIRYSSKVLPYDSETPDKA